MIVVKNIIKIISDICFLLVFVYLFTFIPIPFGYKPLVVQSMSNDTNFKSGSLIYYKKVELDELKIGDVILRKSEDNHITNKITDLNGNVIETSSGKIKYNKILGKVGEVYVPYLGIYVNFINNHKTLLYIIIGYLIVDILLGELNIFGKNSKNI